MVGAYRDPAEVKQDHTCTCPGCDPSVRVASMRVSNQHIGVRFWDEDGPEANEQRRAKILLNGVKVDGAFEAVLGSEGAVWRYRGVPSAGRIGKHYCITCRERADRLIADNAGLFPTEGVPELQLCQEKLTGKVEMIARGTDDEQIRVVPA